MKKILVLFTGGTIGSEVDKCGTISVSKEKLLISLFLQQYPEYKDKVDFTHKTILDELSENMTFDILAKLTASLREVEWSDYDGVIITHGTDTLAYTANYLSILLANVKVPVVLVSSNQILSNPNANGIQNFKGAVDLIDKNMAPGLYVTYNTAGITKVIYGSRLTQCESFTDDFNSITKLPLGVVDQYGDFTSVDKELMAKIINKDNNHKYDELISKIGLLNSKILLLNPFVGLNYDMLDLDNVDAILHTLYHSGTACTKGDRTNLLRFIEKCKTNDKDIYIGPIYGEDNRDVYESTADILTAGGDIIMNCSAENAYVKLNVAYSIISDHKAREEFIYSDINNEFIIPSKQLIKRR
ncbi:MAG: asparaginase domain-containing protein [Bacilli bacterium]|nr:asparaginase domain-containing protein [Bacilli bacterium]